MINKKQTKQKLRKKLSLLREAIAPQRRRIAACSLYDRVLSWGKCTGMVLSYASFRSELDTFSLNEELAHQGRLTLPRMQLAANKSWKLALYRITDIHSQLIKNSLGIFEPDPSFCDRIPLHFVSLALVPGLGFDTQRQRIGYGKGFYDRLLAEYPGVESIGIGFREQLLTHPLSVESHDMSLNSLLLL